MLYLDKKVDLLTNLNEQNAVQKLKYKGIIDTHEKTISLLQEDARKNSQMLSDESRRKKKWRNATFVTSGLLLLTWGMIVYL